MLFLCKFIKIQFVVKSENFQFLHRYRITIIRTFILIDTTHNNR